mmetsp:Transcript_46409/g.86722  ORF Transcript_46409/g.86722 Transcript_46409/m.86722 type:complete len:297 (+) Transcript_46409:16-906(+)
MARWASLGLFGCALLVPGCRSTFVSSDKALWGGATDIAQCVLASPFITSVCDGSLEATQWAQYMVQDLGCYMPGATAALKKLYQRSVEEHGNTSNWTVYFRQLHQSYEEYGATEAQGWNLEKVSPSGSCAAYVNFLQRTAETEPLAQGVIAFAPCSVLWDWLAGKLTPCLRQGNAYNGWIRSLQGTKKSADFAADDGLLQAALTTDRNRSVETFREAMIHEYLFFNSVVLGFRPPEIYACAVPQRLREGGKGLSLGGVALVSVSALPLLALAICFSCCGRRRIADLSAATSLLPGS